MTNQTQPSHSDERLLLAIETSCDDTSVAVLKGMVVLSNVTYTQEMHAKWGGVVPEVASRAHLAKMVPTLEAALAEAEVKLTDIEAIAVTQGPGLLGSLLVGINMAKGLAQGLNIPLVGVHHMHAHMMAHFLQEKGKAAKPTPSYPFICLTVSGGHTQLLRVDGPLGIKVLGQTLDDAAGEAFDKSAKLLGLPYPGGPLIDRYAQMGHQEAFALPKPRIAGLDFSFSGLKTAIANLVAKESLADPDFKVNRVNDLCAVIQARIVQILVDKLLLAAKQEGLKTIALAGGVSANSGLRGAVKALEAQGFEVFIPPMSYCTDNAAMIGASAQSMVETKHFAALTMEAKPRWPFDEFWSQGETLSLL